MAIERGDIGLYAGLAALVFIPIFAINFFLGSRHAPDPAPPKTEAVSPQIVAAELGDSDKSYKLAHAYRDGTGVDANIGKAADWYRTAAKQGHRQARLELGLLLCEGKVPQRDPAEAVTLLKSAPQDTAGAACLCRMYVKDGSDGEAAPACQRAAKGGSAEGARLLGTLYREGRSVGRDVVTAGEYFSQAVTAGDAEAGDFAMKQSSLCDADAGAGNPESCLFMAGFGDAPAQFYAGNNYYTGRGVTKDMAMAAKWYRKAAENGMMKAQLSLGRMLATGEGGKADPDEAYAWLYVAAHNKTAAKMQKRILQDMENLLAKLGEQDRARADQLAGEYLGKYGSAGGK